jgi:methylenetetrahydrofolate--tRNA-(uracil-5-)-methyltransferase
MKVTVIGAGLAGCEAAAQLAAAGIEVTLYEMKPTKFSPAHRSADFSELVCSNSFRAANVENAVGLLKEEMRRLGSLIMRAADATAIPAGGALAVDRDAFSARVTREISSCPLIAVVRRECTRIPQGPVIIASGPLTSDPLAEAIRECLGGNSLHFFDAAAPIVTAESIDLSRVFFASRYDKGTPDYINCPLNKEEYDAFYDALVTADGAQLKDFDRQEQKVFEACMPVEVLAKRGRRSLCFGPMKPAGLTDPRTGRWPYAVVQLRKDNARGPLYNMVGFQTHLTFGEQKRVFSMIPGLENAEFVRYGVLHRNTYIDSPRHLDSRFSLKKEPRIFFAGQMTGVEGYVESAASGLAAGLHMARKLTGRPPVEFPASTAVGALAAYISDESVVDFQPMNINFGIMDPPTLLPGQKKLGKKEKNIQLADRALRELDALIRQNKLR